LDLSNTSTAKLFISTSLILGKSLIQKISITFSGIKGAQDKSWTPKIVLVSAEV
jgi:hypothetical protein